MKPKLSNLQNPVVLLMIGGALLQYHRNRAYNNLHNPAPVAPNRQPRSRNVIAGAKDNVEVSFNAVKDLPLGELVAKSEIDASPERVADLLWDVENYPDWMPRVKRVESFTPNRTNRTDWLLFSIPGGDRDIISEMKQSTKGDVITLTFAQKEGVKFAPPVQAQRLTLREGSWKLSPSGSGGTSVVYRLRSDPGVDANVKMLQRLAAKGVEDLFAALEKEA